ncbi:MAG TPA: glycine cleavage T C-terminal barrel domain-containing protein [Rhizomicrobium sp.]
MNLQVTPFHFRAADANAGNQWMTRGGFTLAAAYSGTEEEALAARFGVIIGDVSWRWRVMAEGARTGEFLSHLTTRDAAALAPGVAHRALWLSDGGAVRGAGLIARYGRQSFLLSADAPDRKWVADAARLFDVSLRDVTQAEGGLAIVGPHAWALLHEAGLETDIAPLAFRKLFWGGLDITLARWGEGYELWCEGDDALIVWDRLTRAGGGFALKHAGLAALDVLDVEAGILRAGRDYEPASDGHAAAPTPGALGLDHLVDKEHLLFNGRAAWLKSSDSHTVMGVELDSSAIAPHAVLYAGTRAVGRILTCVTSPALRRAIGFASLERSHAAPGTQLRVTPPPSRAEANPSPVAASVVALPFLPPPDVTA